VTAVSPQRVRSDILSLVHRALDKEAFSHAAVRAVRRHVQFDSACMLTLDPATLLPTGAVAESGDCLPAQALRRLTEIEVAEPDVNKFADLARRSRPAASLSHATGGALDRSRRHRELRRPHGLQDELRAALVSDAMTWGAITLGRREGRTDFTLAETRLLASLAPLLADGLRRAAVLTGRVAGGDGETEPGLLLLDDDGAVKTANAAARRWLGELAGGADPGLDLPLAVRAVAGRARRVVAGGCTDTAPARALVRAVSGRWLLVRGTRFENDPGGRVAVTIEPAGPPQLAPLIADAHGLTERERGVTQLVAGGLSTEAIAQRLFLSSWTVQDHLKAIFAKLGVSTRGELVARVFFEQQAPRLTGARAVSSNGATAAPMTATWVDRRPWEAFTGSARSRSRQRSRAVSRRV
jgi:DNA-binding CsgD family transcriptional regulator